jgi:hypothetical protein
MQHWSESKEDAICQRGVRKNRRGLLGARYNLRGVIVVPDIHYLMLDACGINGHQFYRVTGAFD